MDNCNIHIVHRAFLVWRFASKMEGQAQEHSLEDISQRIGRLIRKNEKVASRLGRGQQYLITFASPFVAFLLVLVYYWQPSDAEQKLMASYFLAAGSVYMLVFMTLGFLAIQGRARLMIPSVVRMPSLYPSLGVLLLLFLLAALFATPMVAGSDYVSFFVIRTTTLVYVLFAVAFLFGGRTVSRLLKSPTVRTEFKKRLRETQQSITSV